MRCSQNRSGTDPTEILPAMELPEKKNEFKSYGTKTSILALVGCDYDFVMLQRWQQR